MWCYWEQQFGEPMGTYLAHHWLVSETVVVDKKNTSVGVGIWFFCNTHMFWIFGEKNNRIKEPSVLGIWKISESKEPLVLGVWKKNQNQKKHQFWVFQKLQRTAGFYERTGKDPAVLGGCLIYLKKLRTLVIYNNQVF